ncbi:4-amino-4-deoxychorismate lyase [Ectothiorhodospira magna]|uniref:Aminodeoxychorismate lyase n=1 Tax=Ectothiorhodospira magna TaxID=867345 RepID=A0A1H9A4A3_9GAMM|nr:aminodeoxychorismate lyase [Ectothiorhodospira magna]SEP71341.1 4-amino-4-deoxychorismate lyase [Ectothiorhodospira magna]
MILVNGQSVDVLPVDDRGLQYGDGLFETLRIQGGRVCHWPLHLERLQEGCQRLGIVMPQRALLEAEASQVAAHYPDGVLKLVVTRGSGPRGYRPPDTPSPTRILIGRQTPASRLCWSRTGVQVRICQMRLSTNPVLAGIKHLNRLEQVLARSEWAEDDQEGLMLDGDNHVVEGTMTNLFLLQGGRLFTPLLDRCGIAGITRRRIMALAQRRGMACIQSRITLDDLYRADGLFLCNTLIGIWPVRLLEGRQRPVPDEVHQLHQQLVDDQG